MTPPTVEAAELKFAQGLFDLSLAEYGGSAVAFLKLSDGTEKTFGWFHDEISYSKRDFIGKTMEQIQAMHYRRDMAYLRSP